MFDTEIDHLHDVAALLAMANDLAEHSPELSRLLLGAQDTLSKAIMGLEEQVEALGDDPMLSLYTGDSQRRLH